MTKEELTNKLVRLGNMMNEAREIVEEMKNEVNGRVVARVCTCCETCCYTRHPR